MRKAKLILAVAFLALIFGAQAAMAGSIETLVNQQGADGKTDGTYLTITRQLLDSGLYRWTYTLHNGAPGDAVLHSFSVGLAVNDTATGTGSGHYLNYTSSIAGATIDEFSERCLWTFNSDGMAAGETATFSFDTDLTSITELIDKARNGSYVAIWRNVATPAPATPEPGTMAVLLTGLAGTAGALLKRKR